MSNGTYDSTLSNVTLNSSYTTVTFTSSAYVYAAAGNAVQGGATNAYTVFNDGTIVSHYASGILLKDGGSITNGDSDNTGALISGGGYAGIEIIGAGGTVANYGTVTSNAYGIVLSFGGAVVNTGTAALIDGGVIGIVAGTYNSTMYSASIGNDEGTITGALDGILVFSGGTVTNTGTGALIEGGSFGVSGRNAALVVVNEGTIEGGGGGISGIELDAGGTIINSGSAALIEGVTGIKVLGTGTVTNYGEIIGTGGTAIRFTDSSDVLIVEAGSTLSGVVQGDNGTLELAGGAGAGTFSGIGSEYLSFSRITVASGASWTLTGSETIGGFMSLVDSGALTIADTLTVEGALTVDGSLVNDGSIAGVVTLLSGGYLDNAGTGAVIQGAGVAVQMMGGAASVYNQGTIEGTGLPGDGIDLGNGGKVTDNGTASLIEGTRYGVYVQNAAGTVDNAGTVEVTGTAGRGILLSHGGIVDNIGTASLIRGGYYGIQVHGTDGTITNEGTIEANGITGGNPGIGINLGGGSGGSISNVGTASLIYGRQYAIVGNSGVLSVSNAGMIQSEQGYAVAIDDGGGVFNTGTILSPGADGIYFAQTGTVTNSGTAALIKGSVGIQFNHAGTVTNYGTIQGTGGQAIQFNASGSVLIVEGGSKLIGQAGGDGGTLEFDSAGGAGTVSGLGNNGAYANFSLYDVNAGAHWSMSGSNSILSGDTLDVAGTLAVLGSLTIASGGSLVNDSTIKVNGGVLIDYTAIGGTGTIDITNGGTVEFLGSATGATIDFQDASKVELANTNGVTIRDFAAGDVIDLTGISYVTGHTVTYDSGLHEFLVTDVGGDTVATIGAADFTLTTNYVLTLQQDGVGTDIVEKIPCYVCGTRLLTAKGEVAVEDLAVGDLLVTRSGRLQPALWIGRSKRAAARLAADEMPVRFRRGSLGPDLPHRDLIVSAGHCMVLDGALVPARLLVNGISVVRETGPAVIEFFHVELPAHDILLAEGAPSESYLDTGNRSAFGSLDHADRPAKPGAERCAPLVTSGLELIRRRAALVRQLAAFGVTFTDDPDLRLIADGVTVAAESVEAGIHRFRLSGRPDRVRIASRSAVPGEVIPNSRDTRRLGVAVSKIVLSGAGLTTEIDHAAPVLDDGYHRPEARFRWTDGDAALPQPLLAALGEDLVVEIHVRQTMRYPVLACGDAPRQARAA